MAEKHTLEGLRIVVTRPRDQAVPLALGIERAGGIPVLFPLLDIVGVQDGSVLREQISRLEQYDLAIFISPNAVQFGMSAIRELSTLPGSLRIATVGHGSARALREFGIANVISPTERFDSEGLLAMPELQNVANWHVLIFRGDSGRELLGDTLKARGATVEYAACYQRNKSSQDAGTLLAAGPDAITVTSSEALAHLWQMLDDAARAALQNTTLFVPHPRIAELATQQGWRHVRIAASGDDGMLSALESWAEQRRASAGRESAAPDAAPAR
jgi:uroporphyrinogen-III synthase